MRDAKDTECRKTPRADVDYKICRSGRNNDGDITHITCAYCDTFSVYKSEPGMKLNSSDRGFYNRMRAKIVKHLFAEHRPLIGTGLVSEGSADAKCNIDPEYGGCMPICKTHKCDGDKCVCPEPGKATVATDSDSEKLAKIRAAIETALKTESLKHSVVTREIADILGLPHEGPDPEAAAFVQRLKTNLAKRGYK